MKRISRIRKGSTPAGRAEILERYRQSGRTQREFAQQMGMGVSTLQLWLRKAAVAQAQAGSAWVEIPNLLSATPVSATYRLQFPKGLVLEIRSGFQAEELSQLLQRVHRL